MANCACVKHFTLGILAGITVVIFMFTTFVFNDWSLSSFQIVSFSRRENTSHETVNRGILNDQGFLPKNDSCEGAIAAELSKKVRVLVWVMTSPQTLQTRAKAIKDTWGKRCNVILYFSSKNDSEFPAVGLGTPEGRSHLTAKTMLAFSYIYKNHLDDADWFMKADDDTYVIVENLRYFLSDKDTNKPAYYGHLFLKNVPQGYYSGGSGYVISKEALRRFGRRAINSTLCAKDGGSEDVKFGFCMEKLGVPTIRTVDKSGRSLFHPLRPSSHLMETYPKWYPNYTAGGVQKGYGVSRYAVSFHYVTIKKMAFLDFLLYHLQAFGVHPISRQCNQTRLLT